MEAKSIQLKILKHTKINFGTSESPFDSSKSESKHAHSNYYCSVEKKINVFYTIKSFATNKKNGLKAHKKHDALLR
jgi:hypothetical protein